MDLILSVPAVDIGRRQVLDQAAPEKDIDQLHPPADAKDRSAGGEKRAKEGKLRPVQLPVDRQGALIRLSEPGGVNISAAGQQESAEGGQIRRMEVCFKGGMADGKCAFVVGCMFRDTGDENLHGRLLRVCYLSICTEGHLCHRRGAAGIRGFCGRGGPEPSQEPVQGK